MTILDRPDGSQLWPGASMSCHHICTLSYDSDAIVGQGHEKVPPRDMRRISIKCIQSLNPPDFRAHANW